MATLKTSQELWRLSSVTLNCQVTKIVWIQVLDCQNCNQSSGLSLQLSKSSKIFSIGINVKIDKQLSSLIWKVCCWRRRRGIATHVKEKHWLWIIKHSGHYKRTVVLLGNSLGHFLFQIVGKLSKGKMRINNSFFELFLEFEGRSPQGASSAEPASLKTWQLRSKYGDKQYAVDVGS